MGRLLLALLFLLAFLAVLVAGVILVRHQAAEMAIRNVLSSEGIRNASFEVTDLDKAHARVENLTLGRYRNVKAKSIEVRFSGLEGWDPWAWNPAVAEVRVSGLDLRLNAQGGGPLNDPDLDRLLSGPEEAEVGEAAAIPPIVIENARITATTAQGETELLLDGDLVRPKQAALAGRFTYSLETPFGLSKGGIELFQAPEEALQVKATAESAALAFPGAKIGALQAAIELVLPEDELPHAKGELIFNGISPLVGYVETLTLAIDADPTRMTFDLVAQDDEGEEVGQGRIAVTRIDSRPQINADLALNATSASARLGLIDRSGSLTVESQLSATLPPLVDLIHQRGGKLIQLLEEASLATRLKVSAEQLTIPDKVLGLSADLHLDVLLEDAKLRAWISEESRLAVTALDPEWSLLADLPDDTRGALWRNLSLTFPVEEEAGLQASARRDERGIAIAVAGPINLSSGRDTEVDISGRIDARVTPDLDLEQGKVSGFALTLQAFPILGNQITRLALTGDAVLDEAGAGAVLDLDAELAEARQDDLVLENLSLRLPMLLTANREGSQFAMLDEGGIGVEQVLLEGEPLLREAASFTLDRLALRQGQEGRWFPRLLIASEALALSLPGSGDRLALRDIGIELAGEISADGLEGEASLSFGDVDLPSESLRLSSVTVTAPLPPERLEREAVSLRVGSASLVNEGQSFSGMSFDASLTKRGQVLRIAGRGRGPNGQGSIALDLSHDLVSERGKLDARWGPITFAPDGLQPKALSAELEELTDVSGTVGIEAKAEWSPRSQNIAANVKLSSLSGTLLPARVDNLNGNLSFLSLSPPVSNKTQQITIEELDVGVPLSDLLLQFEIVDAQGGPGLDAKSLQTDFAGGRLTASPFRVAGPEDSFGTTVEVTHVKLDRLTEILDLGDVQLEGRVIGQLPLILDLGTESIAIDNGWLQAVDEGVIRIPNAAERLGLGQISQEQKQLLFALDALSDFHYTYLYATVSFGAEGDLDLALTLEGNNPAVLDGYPFKFNVTFGVDLADLLAAFRRGREITPELFDGAWSLK